MKNTADMTTSGLLSKLFKTTSIRRFVDQYDDQLNSEPFHKHLDAFCKQKGMIPSAVVKAANIERTYGLQIFRGIKNPSRDKVIQLAFGFSCDVDESQTLLKAAGKSALYPKIKRDAVIIYCLKKRKTVFEAQDILNELQLPLLGGETA